MMPVFINVKTFLLRKAGKTTFNQGFTGLLISKCRILYTKWDNFVNEAEQLIGQNIVFQDMTFQIVLRYNIS